MKPWIIVLIVLAVIAVILGLLYYFGKKHRQNRPHSRNKWRP